MRKQCSSVNRTACSGDADDDGFHFARDCWLVPALRPSSGNYIGRPLSLSSNAPDAIKPLFMDHERLKELLRQFKQDDLDLDQVVERLRHLPFEDLGYATVDHHRSIRQGFPEVIFGQ